MALKFLIILLIIMVHPKTPESHWRIPHAPSVFPHPPPAVLHPLCSSQFALVNRACSRLPYNAVPPPSPTTPPSPPSPDDGDDHEQHHGHRHRRHVYKETLVEEECCRWLKEVDDVCACNLLATLPSFLTWPGHNYTVVVDETCDVTFRCSSI